MDNKDNLYKYLAIVLKYSKMFFKAIFLKYIYYIYKSCFNACFLIYLRWNDYNIILKAYKITLKNSSFTLTI